MGLKSSTSHKCLPLITRFTFSYVEWNYHFKTLWSFNSDIWQNYKTIHSAAACIYNKTKLDSRDLFSSLPFREIYIFLGYGMPDFSLYFSKMVNFHPPIFVHFFQSFSNSLSWKVNNIALNKKKSSSVYWFFWVILMTVQ